METKELVLDNKEIAKRIIREQLLVVYKDQTILMNSLRAGLSKERLLPVHKRILHKHYLIYIEYASVVFGSAIKRLGLEDYWDVVKEIAGSKFVVTDDDIIVY